MTERDDYLRTVLDMDPRTEGRSILELRRRHRGSAAPFEARVPSDPEAALHELAELSEGFLVLAPDELRRRLAEVDLAQHPDLERRRRRLARAADVREAFDAARADDALPAELVARLAEMLTRPSREAAAVRQSLLQRLGAAGGTDGKRVVARLRKHHPRIVDLDPEGFEELARARTIRRERRPLRVGGSFLLIWIVARVVITLIRRWSE